MAQKELTIAQGGTDEITQQAAINTLTNVAAATNEHVLTKDTGTGNAIFKAASSGAPTDATYIVQTANGTLSNEQVMGALATGLVKNTTTTGVQSIAVDGTDYISSMVADTTPQLGGDLDLNGKNIDFPTTANISDCLDEDNMASNSATKLATQQSIKAYVDANIPAALAKCKLARTAAQAIATGGFVKVQLNVEDFDVGSIGDPVTNYRITVATAGYYLVIGYTSTEAQDDQDPLWCAIYKNGAEARSNIEWLPLNGNIHQCQVSDVFSCSVSDYFELYIKHQYGSDRNTNTSTGYTPFLAVIKLQ